MYISCFSELQCERQSISLRRKIKDEWIMIDGTQACLDSSGVIAHPLITQLRTIVKNGPYYAQYFSECLHGTINV